MNIQIYNDQKGKHHSFEATINEGYGSVQINGTAYGATEAEAKENLLNDIAQLVVKLDY